MWKELLELRQDPRLFGIIFIAPIVQLTLLGYAATTDVKNVPMVVVDQDRIAAEPRADHAVRRLAALHVVGSVDERGELDPWLRGRAWMALGIPAGFSERVGAGRPATVQVIADGTDSNSTNVALGYAGNCHVLQRGARARAAVAAGQEVPPRAIDARIRVWFNPQLESRDFMIPGIVALLLLVITTNLSSMAVVREKELGTLEQLNVTPVTRWQLILGKLLPYGVIGILDVILVTPSP